MKKYAFLMMFISCWCMAQQDTIILQDVVVTDIRLSNNRTQRLIKLNDSIIQYNKPSLTELLRFNSTIYFKENGNGMVSSPSFRGTTAQQTSVLWNGIGINSGFLGQTDFNTISSMGVDEIIIKPGGGSLSHGSGAIGGSIHLNHALAFDQNWNGEILGGYGSFGTYKAFGKLGYSNDELAIKFSFNRNSSDNDFEVEEENFVNRNAQYFNNTYNLNLAYKLNPNNTVSLFTEKYNDERHFVILEESATKSKYQNDNFRSLLQWDNQFNRVDQTLKVGFFKEEFIYFNHIDRDYFSKGNIDKFIAQYSGDYHLSPKINIGLFGEISSCHATGDNTGIEDENQTDKNIGVKFAHQVLDKIYYELGIRKEFNADFESPTLYSLGLSVKPLSFATTKFHFSKNFRSPTLNDLYWEPGGNKDLLSERSVQFELTQEFSINKQRFGLSAYVNDIEDMIQWVPSGAGYWEPKNTNQVQAKGIEAFLHLNKTFGNHNLSLNSQYAYTSSENQDTEKQLVYVPYHKWNGSLSYNYKPLSLYLQGIFIGDSYTTADENTNYILKGYKLFNLGLIYNFSHLLHHPLEIGVKVNNIFDAIYEVKPKYYMPKRNFEIQLKTNF